MLLLLLFLLYMYFKFALDKTTQVNCAFLGLWFTWELDRIKMRSSEVEETQAISF